MGLDCLIFSEKLLLIREMGQISTMIVYSRMLNIAIERIVLLDFIHRLVSQKN